MTSTTLWTPLRATAHGQDPAILAHLTAAVPHIPPASLNRPISHLQTFGVYEGSSPCSFVNSMYMCLEDIKGTIAPLEKVVKSHR